MNRTVSIATFSLALLLVILAGLLDPAIHLADNMKSQDIYFSFIEGQRLLNGENPYIRVLDGDMLNNLKYATYFPVFYELSYLSEKYGLVSFHSWLGFWHIVFIAFEIAIAVLLYLALARRQLPWIGVFAAAFWLFNRWTLQLVQVADLDFIPIFFMLLSLEFFPDHKWLSLFFFSISLGVKQIAVFIVPLYLIWLWQSSEQHRVKDVLLGTGIIASVPFLSALPFLAWSAQGFIYSVLFSVTRLGGNNAFLAPSLSFYIGSNPIIDRILMLGLMLMLYMFAWYGHMGKYALALLVMLTFVCFNPTLFFQYILWTIPLSLLLGADLLGGSVPRLPVPA